MTLYARPLGLDERPRPCCRGLWCRGVPRGGALPVLEPVLLTDLKLDVLDRIGNPLVEVEREWSRGTFLPFSLFGLLRMLS